MALKAYCQRCKAHYYPLFRSQPCPCNMIYETQAPIQRAKRLRRVLKKQAHKETQK